MEVTWNRTNLSDKIELGYKFGKLFSRLLYQWVCRPTFLGGDCPPPVVALLNPATLAEFSKRATIRFADFFSVSMVTTPLFRCLFSE